MTLNDKKIMETVSEEKREGNFVMMKERCSFDAIVQENVMLFISESQRVTTTNITINAYKFVFSERGEREKVEM